jgi:glycosyltransferase involved in cell wall biosynthesis
MGSGLYKGADLAFEIARHFEWEYKFKICGNQDPEHKRLFETLINVDLTGWVDRADAFSGVSLLIVPARWPETFGRIVAEAGWMGIPSIVSDRGGLREAVGPGGLIIDDPEDLEMWTDAIDLVMDDDRSWGELSSRAMTWSSKFNVNNQVLELEAYLDGNF